MSFVVIIGCGGREHAIAKSLKKNSNIKLITIGNFKNPGLHKISDFYICLDLTNNFEIYSSIKSYNADYVIIGPEAPLENGLADYLISKNIPVIGPTKLFAKIETDKYFCRKLMEKFNLERYSPDYIFIHHKTKNAKELFLDFSKKYEGYAIKPCGLCSGKGVKLSGEHFKDINEAYEYIDYLIDKKENFVVEEKLIGQEFSLMSFTDSKTLKHMPPVKDYKRAYDGDKGPNTGSMGSISFKNHLLPFLSENDVEEAQIINKNIIDALNKNYNINLNENYNFLDTDNSKCSNSSLDLSEDLEDVFLDKDDKLNNIGYRGILYGSFMKTNHGIKVIEYNARFGDPECINILEILNTDLDSIFRCINNRSLNTIDIDFSCKTTLCKYIVPSGYPLSPVKNEIIKIGDVRNNNIIFSSIEETNDNLYLKGSRALALIYSGDNMNEIIEQSNLDGEKITGPVEYRKDIGKINLSYNDCGVSIHNGNLSVQKIKECVKSTFNERVIHNFGDYSGLLNGNYLADDLVLVGSIDGVGTKTSLLPKILGDDAYEVLGQDIVNHSINDILVKNAKPLLFMDYIASSKIDPEKISLIVNGMAKSCREHKCPILGGETAEMPGTYKNSEHDIVGSIVGYVDKTDIIDGMRDVEEGNIIIGIPSVSAHTNGYSMIRKIHEINTIPDDTLKWLCNPHKSYFHEVNTLNIAGIKINALCHITGGGFVENPPRVLNENLKIKFNIQMNKHFKKIQELGNVSDMEMYKTFNCGIGMLVFIEKENSVQALEILNKFPLGAVVCGEVYQRDNDENQINF